MGCTGSRYARRGGVRSCSGPVAHTVALKSSTLGSLSLDRDEEMMKWRDDGGVGVAANTPTPTKQQVRRQTRQVLDSPAKTPAREPDEVINVWELMDGLDDNDADTDAGGEEERRLKSAPDSPEFDPDIITAFRKALDEVSPLPHVLGDDDKEAGVKKREIQEFPGIVRARVSAFQQKINAKLAKLAPPPSPPPPPASPPPPPDSARKVVLYLTSLRGIRKTYEDCWSTRSILQGYGVRVDERDLSMHAGFKGELYAALGGAAGRLPQVFADGRHIGGAEEVRRMHEAGELSKELEACEMAPPGAGPGKGVAMEACSGCGGVRFVPCEECSGSCKVFLEEVGSFRRCPECNENGLVRCPLCSL
jgi:glutaredoxin domain-containing cysteine-rich protein 1